MNDETLTFYYYKDGLTRAEREQVASLLATDEAVARRYQALSQQLDRLGAAVTASPPADMVERWHENLNRAVRSEAATSRKPVLHSGSFFWGAAITAALAIGIGIGVFISVDDSSQTIAPSFVAASNPNSGAFVRGLQVHLRESERGLTTISMSDSANRTLLIANIVEQNRLYEKIAQQNGSQSLARVLRAFDLVLIKLAADDITPQEAKNLQAKLLFELNVVLTKLARDPSDESLSI